MLDEGICRDSVMLRMRQRGVQTSIHYPPIHRFAFFRKICPENADLRVTEGLGARILTLPLYPDLSRGQVEAVCSALHEAAL